MDSYERWFKAMGGKKCQRMSHFPNNNYINCLHALLSIHTEWTLSPEFPSKYFEINIPSYLYLFLQNFLKFRAVLRF